MKNREDLLAWKGLLAFQRVGLIITTIGVTIIVAGQCILRAFNINISGYEEILVMMAFWMYMLGCSYGAFEKSHITADLLSVMMKDGKVKRVIMALKDIITVFLCLIMLIWAIEFFVGALGMGERMPHTPVYRIPMAVGYASMVLGLMLSLLYFACYSYDSIKALFRKEASA